MRVRPPLLEDMEPESGHAADGDPVRAWLGVFAALSGLPRQERAEVQEELSDHLRERVRELMVRGRDEHEAVKAAIEELGGAAEMAARFRFVRVESRRRLAMNLSMLGLAGAAVVMSVVAIVRPGGGQGGQSMYSPRVEQPSGVLAKAIDMRFESTPLGDVMEYFGQLTDATVRVHWDEVESRDAQVTLAAKQVTVAAALHRLTEWITEQVGRPVDYRLTDGVLEVAPREFFDRRERTLASYSLVGAQDRGVEPEGVSKVIQSLVEPDQWRDNGGDLASLYILGGCLFVEAPPRLHDKVRWILGELASAQPEAAERRGPAVGDAGTSLRRYELQNSDAVSLSDRFRRLVGDAKGLKIVPDARTNSLLVGGSLEAVEAGIISGLDVDSTSEAGPGRPSAGVAGR